MQLLGFTLIEILITLFILSFVLLSMDAMQVNALRASKEHFYYAVALQQLRNIRAQISLGFQVNEMLPIWNEQNKQLLPNGAGEISGHFPHYQIRLHWGQKNDCQYNLIGLSGCLIMNVDLL